MHQSSKYKFSKSERLSSYKVIGELFNRASDKTRSFLVYPYKFVLLQEEASEPQFPEILISVPKRNFKKAVDRNRLKRLSREAYRLEKKQFPHKTYIGFLYVGKEILDLETIKKAIRKGLEKI